MTRHTTYAVLGTIVTIWAVTLRTLAGGNWSIALLVVVGLGLLIASSPQQGRR